MRDIKSLLAELDTLYASGDRAAMERFFNAYIPEAERAGEYGTLLMLYNEQQGLLRTGGRAEEAAAVTKKALALVEKLGLQGTKHHAVTLINAGTAHAMASYTQEALAYFVKAEALLKALGEGGYTLASLYNNMSHALDTLGRGQEALAAQERALAVIRALPGEEGAAAVSELGLASALMRLGRLAEAEEYIKNACRRFESEEGASDPHRCSLKTTAAELKYRMGDFAASVSLYEEALALIKTIYGENDAYRITAQNLARAKERMGV